MKRVVEVAPRARRDLATILQWRREHLGARAALKVARTVQSRLRAMEAGELVGAKLASGVSRYMGVVARRHVIVFRAQGDALLIVRIVHGAQDIEAIAAQLEAGED